MSQSVHEMHETRPLDLGGVDARRPCADTGSLDETRTGTKARLSRQSLQFFLLALAAVAIAIGAVVAVIGLDRLV